MIMTRGSTRYPANCAACPAGLAGTVILPSSFQPAQITVNLVPTGTTFTERINQLDLKVAKNFKINRFTFSPQLELFNVTNSDPIISYVSRSVLSSSYGFANSVLQPRIIGVGAQGKW